MVRTYDHSLWLGKFKAFGLHLIFSSCLLAVALYLVYILWFPAPLDYAMGISDIFWMMLGIDLILGPLLTFVIYKPLKKGLKGDLAVILMVQLMAFSYGIYTVSKGRPVWQAFVIDDVELVRAVDVNIQPGEIVQPEYRASFFKSPRWVNAGFSDNLELAKEQKQQDMMGNSITYRSTYYRPIETARNLMLKNMKPLSQLEKYNDTDLVKLTLANYPSARGYLPVKAYENDISILIDAEAKPIAFVKLKPWK